MSKHVFFLDSGVSLTNNMHEVLKKVNRLLTSVVVLVM